MSVIADEDASVRALPPSRRASDTSLASRMSSASHLNWASPSTSKRPASLLTVATGASNSKLRSAESKRKSLAPTEGSTKEEVVLDSDDEVDDLEEEDGQSMELKTAPTSPAVDSCVLSLAFAERHG